MNQPAEYAVAECTGKCCCFDKQNSKTNSFFGRFFTFCALHLFGFDRHNATKCEKRSRKLEVSRDAWLQSYGLLKSKDVPPDLCELHLVVGYRPNPSSFSYCVKSIFYPTNEALNFWTHFIALIIIGNKLTSIVLHKLQGPLSDPLYYPLWAYSVGCCGMLLGSCCAHVFNCRSRNVRETCWFCDYTSITLSCAGSAISYNNFVCPYECMGFSIKYFSEWLVVLGIVGQAVCCYSRRMTSNVRYVLRSLVFAILHVASAIPCLYLYLARGLQNFSSVFTNVTTVMEEDIRCNLNTTNFHPLYTLVTVFCGLTVYFNVSKFPEKLFPGTFDIVGHSHQWMHISIALAFYFQIDLLEVSLLKADEMRMNGTLTPEDLFITWWNTIGSMIVIGLCCTVTTCLMSLKPHKTKLD